MACCHRMQDLKGLWSLMWMNPSKLEPPKPLLSKPEPTFPSPGFGLMSFLGTGWIEFSHKCCICAFWHSFLVIILWLLVSYSFIEIELWFFGLVFAVFDLPLGGCRKYFHPSIHHTYSNCHPSISAQLWICLSAERHLYTDYVYLHVVHSWLYPLYRLWNYASIPLCCT